MEKDLKKIKSTKCGVQWKLQAKISVPLQCGGDAGKSKLMIQFFLRRCIFFLS